MKYHTRYYLWEVTLAGREPATYWAPSFKALTTTLEVVVPNFTAQLLEHVVRREDVCIDDPRFARESNWRTR